MQTHWRLEKEERREESNSKSPSTTATSRYFVPQSWSSSAQLIYRLPFTQSSSTCVISWGKTSILFKVAWRTWFVIAKSLVRSICYLYILMMHFHQWLASATLGCMFDYLDQSSSCVLCSIVEYPRVVTSMHEEKCWGMVTSTHGNTWIYLFNSQRLYLQVILDP
jgi:hypothetical protein